MKKKKMTQMLTNKMARSECSDQRRDMWLYTTIAAGIAMPSSTATKKGAKVKTALIIAAIKLLSSFIYSWSLIKSSNSEQFRVSAALLAHF